MAASKPKKEKLPRGVARLPQWWMEITPHRTLNIEADEYRRKAEEEQAVMYANLAAKQDYEQKYGEGGAGAAGAAAAGGNTASAAAGGGGYQRGPGKSSDQGGVVGPDGRQFKPGEAPEGYVPGGHDAGEAAMNVEKVSLSSPGGGHYARDEDKQWEKPDWMKVKLKHTGTGDNIRKGEYGPDGKGVDTGPIKKTILPPEKDQSDAAAQPAAAPKVIKKVVKRVSKKVVKAAEPAPAAPPAPAPVQEEEPIADEEYYEEEVIDEEEFIEEIVVDDDGNEVYEDGERQ
jgi:hypothetical protein